MSDVTKTPGRWKNFTQKGCSGKFYRGDFHVAGSICLIFFRDRDILNLFCLENCDNLSLHPDMSIGGK